MPMSNAYKTTIDCIWELHISLQDKLHNTINNYVYLSFSVYNDSKKSKILIFNTLSI